VSVSSSHLRDPIRLGIAGLGSVAQAVYLPLLARLGDRFAISAVAELSAIVRDSVGGRYGVPPAARHSSLDAMLRAGGIDALVVLTSGSHAEVAAMVLEAGLPVLCEKPLAYSHASIDELEDVLERTHGRLMLGYMKQYDPAVREATRKIAAEASVLGALRTVDVTVLHPSSESQLAFAHLLPGASDIADEDRAAQQRRVDAERTAVLGPAAGELGAIYSDILLGSVVHDLAVVRHLAGDPEAVDVAHAWPPGAWPPSLGVVARLPEGVRLSIGWHYLPRYPAYREDVRLHFEGGSVELTFPAPYRLHMPTRLAVSTGGGETLQRRSFESIEEAFETQLLAFEALVRDGTAPLAGIAEGRRDVTTCQAIAACLARTRGIPLAGEAAAERAAERPPATGMPGGADSRPRASQA
jgi:myo-inositol 2-dehydrogenase / D-chiro-inositol 1-dehydrogenase